MHCYRCGRRVPDRSPRCENCGQKFSYGQEGGAKPEPPPVVVPPPPAAIVPAPVDKAGLSESIFEVSQANARKTGVPSKSDPTIPARMALHEATDQAVVGFGERDAVPLPEPTDPEAIPSALAAASAQAPVAAPGAAAMESDIAIGKSLSGRLEIVAELGEGPLGVVYKAIDRKKGSVVAVKAIPAAKLPEQALSGRFAETIALVKSLVHPNLVKVYGAGREGDTAFTIMQYLEGLPLRALLDVKRENGAHFTFEEAEPIIGQICQGLSFAHTSLVHGGIKPENVILHVDSLKIVDLGLSRLFSPAEWSEVQQRSKDGGAYLAPEYAAVSAKIDRRADVYSVGAILYEMLTGRTPSGPDSPPISGMNPSVPRAVDRVVAKAMARSPENRYATATELKEAVFRVLGGDILADDLESPVGEMRSSFSDRAIGGEMMETFVDDAADDEAGPGIEIEYLEPGPLKSSGDRDSRDSEEATPVGAIELHEPLWEPDEIAERKPKRTPSGSPLADTRTGMPAPNPGAAAARELFEPAVEDNLARPASPSSIAPTAFVSREVLDPPSRGGGALGHGDHISVEIPVEVEGATNAGEATATGMGPDLRASDWLDVKGPLGQVEPRTLGPATGRPAPPGIDVRSGPERELELHEGSSAPLELDSASGNAAPDVEGPTIRRPGPPELEIDEPRRPTGTPPPWDSRNPRPSSAIAPERDRPTDPARGPAPQDRPTAPRPRPDENPGARALSPASPPALDLALDRPTDAPDRPTSDRPLDRAVPAPPPRVTPPRRTMEMDPPFARGLDAPTSPPRPTFVVRRKSSGAPAAIVFFFLAVALIGGGGWWALTHRDLLQGFVPSRAAHCPSGMVYFGPGAFPLGSEKLDPDRDVYEPLVHKVTTDAYCVDRFEYPNKEGDPPLVNVTIAAADAACAKQGKRLCSENEWERACKGPDGSRFPYGDAYQAGLCNVGTAEKPGTPKQAGTFPSCGRDDGLRDMSGNVWEITASPWPDDPNARVIKGGSAKLPAWGARCSYRDSLAPAKLSDDVGFRCCTSAK